MTAIAFFLIVGTSIAMGVVGFRLTVEFERARFRDHFSLLASYLASNAELGVMLDNEKILRGLAENMVAVGDVQAVEILGKNGKVIVKMVNESIPVASGVVSALVVSHSMGESDSPFLPPAEDQEVLGKVNLSFSFAGLEQLKRQLALRFLFVSLILALVVVIMYWMLSRTIIAPLHELLDVARQVSGGQMSVRARGGALLEISTLAAAFNEMLDTLELQQRQLSEVHASMAKQQVLAEVGKFSMIVAHEIKNPLSIIKGSLEVFRKQGALEVELKQKLLGFVDDEVVRINKLVEDFLLFARPQTPDFRLASLDDLVYSLSQRLSLLQEGVSVATDFSALERGKRLRCDLHLLERALLNLVRNALEATKGKGIVRVRGSCSERLFGFTVWDNGPGVPSADIDRIFEPFYSTKAKGTGLGLAIVKDIISSHGGAISVLNRKSGGAGFTVVLPLQNDELKLVG